MSRIWFTADTHLGHENIIAYCGRPFKDAQEMDEMLIHNWNRRVQPEDIIFHLGDFVFRGRVREVMYRLNGRIIWLKGNHDSSDHVPIRSMVIDHGGFEWTLIHDPADTLANHVLCGHVHEAWKVKRIKDRIIVNVGVDVWNFAPVSIDEILAEVAKTPRTLSDGRKRR